MRTFVLGLLALGSLAPACSVESSVFGEVGVGGSTGASINLAGPDAASSSASSGTTSSVAASGSSASTGVPAAMCGNGEIEVGEECEDFNTTPKDGCDETCLLEGNGNKCPTNAVLKLSGVVLIKGTTVQKKDITSTTCGGDMSPDVAYQVIAGKSGTVTVTLTTPETFERVLAVRTNCNLNPMDTGSCAFDKTTLVTERVVNAGDSFHVVVSGQLGSAGSYDLRLELK